MKSTLSTAILCLFLFRFQHTFAVIFKSESVKTTIKATARGVCVYDLPAKFNVGLENSTYGETQPETRPIYKVSQPLGGMHNTDHMWLDMIVYKRMMQEATKLIPPSQCKLFYVPYFSQWETQGKDGQWKDVNRPETDNEVISYLKYLGRFRNPPGVDHVITLSRIQVDVTGPIALLSNPFYKHMQKLIIESQPGSDSTLHSVPYPAWFRFNPSSVDQWAPGVPWSTIKSVSIQMKAVDPDLPSNAGELLCLHGLQRTLTSVCTGQPLCTVQVPPPCGMTSVVGEYTCTGQIKTKAQAGTQVSSAASFSTMPDQSKGSALVVGCQRGPCWLWGECHKPLGEHLSGPLAVFIGSARPTEVIRTAAVKQCTDRLGVCVLFDTGQREHYRNLLNEERMVRMNEILLSSVFCINPPGDSPTRKGLFDSMLAGCIPVIFDPASLSTYTWFLPDWQAVSVYIPKDTLLSPNFNLVDHLGKMDPATVRAKQSAVKERAYHLQYSEIPASQSNRPGDAFDVMMTGLGV